MEFSLGTILTTVAILLTIFLFVFSLYLRMWHRKDDNYKKEIADLVKNNELLRNARKLDISDSIREHLGEVKSNRIKSTVEKKYESLSTGIIELTVQEISRLWSGMFAERNIIYMRATSGISPSVWKDPFMLKYQGQQRLNIDYYQQLAESEKVICNQTISTRITMSEDELGKAIFERIFIIQNEQFSNIEVLVRLIEIVLAQSEYMDIRVADERKILPYNEDFGITVSIEGDVLLYDLMPSVGGDSLLGGRMILNTNVQSEAVQKYSFIRANSLEIPHGATFDDVVKVLGELREGEIDLNGINKTWSEHEIKEGHKCIGCFIESERTIKEKGWKNEISAKKIWYEMIAVENQKVIDIIMKYKPKNIIEVGCGPGRLIEVVNEMEIDGLISYDEIVGIEADTQMYNYAYKRWQGNNKVEVFNMRVENRLPYEDDHFQLCINAMNIVGWQENERKWLEEMLRCAKVVFFTLYKKGFERDRLEMYKERKHKISDTGVHVDESSGQVVLGDCAVVRNVVSKAYDRMEVEDLCDKVVSRYDANYEIDDKSNRLLYLCSIYK